MQVIQQAFSHSSSSIMIGKIQGNIVDILYAPLNAFEITMALNLAACTRSLMIAITCIVVFNFIVEMEYYNLFYIFIFTFFGAFILSSIGIIVGLYSEKFDQMAGYERFSAEIESDWPPAEFRERQGEFSAYRGPRHQPPGIPKIESLDMSSAIEVGEEDFVIASGQQLHDLCRERKILHLVYAGFATNWCVVGRDYGLRSMRKLGYNLILLRDATMGVEFPDTIHNYAHNNEWLIRNWNHVGRADDAVAMAKGMINNPQHPKLNHYKKGNSSASYGRRRLVETLERFECWQESLKLAESHYLEPTDQLTQQVVRFKVLARAHFGLKQKADLINFVHH